MANTPDETRLKELLKQAVVEVLEERRDLIPQTSSNAHVISSTAIKNILFWIALLLTAVLLFQIVQHPNR